MAKGSKFFCLLHISYIVRSFVAESFHRQIKMKSWDEMNESNKQASKRTNDPENVQWNKWKWMGERRCKVSTCATILVYNMPISIVRHTHTHTYEIMLKAYFHIRYSEHSNQSAFHISLTFKLFLRTPHTADWPTSQPTDPPANPFNLCYFQYTHWIIGNLLDFYSAHCLLNTTIDFYDNNDNNDNNNTVYCTLAVWNGHFTGLPIHRLASIRWELNRKWRAWIDSTIGW